MQSPLVGVRRMSWSATGILLILRLNRMSRYLVLTFFLFFSRDAGDDTARNLIGGGRRAGVATAHRQKRKNKQLSVLCVQLPVI